MTLINDQIIEIFNNDRSLLGSAPPDISAENELLLQIIQKCRRKCKIPHKSKHAQLSHPELQHLIENVLCNRLNKKLAQRFLDQFFYNPRFVAVFIPYVKIASQKIEKNDPDLKNIDLVSDDFLVQKALSISAKSSKINDSLQFISRFFEKCIVKRPRLVLPALGFSLLVLLIISMSFIDFDLSQEAYQKYLKSPLIPFLDATVQTQQNAGMNLRSGQSLNSSHHSPDWHHSFDLALNSYILKDYNSSLAYFKEADAKISRESTVEPNEQSNFYFYYAMAHLGAADNYLFRNRHLHSSVALFQKALTINSMNDWQSTGAAHFFLGMTYALLKDTESAEKVLKEIDPMDPFYAEAHLLLNNAR